MEGSKPKQLNGHHHDLVHTPADDHKIKPLLRTLQRLIASAEADARLEPAEKVLLFQMLEGYAAAAAIRVLSKIKPD